ncbi:MAG TPA: FG-GAP-like repeat-containing protein [Pyrinomonadaceae bacterium]|jgi:hypothetical protein
MKNFTKSVLRRLCFCAAILALGAVLTNAQDARAENSKTLKNILSEIVREKSLNKPFVLITPDDLAKIDAGEMQLLASAAGDPCDSAAVIAFGQTVNGDLTAADCRLPDNSYADFYLFNGSQGQQVTINLSSTAFDAYLGLANDSGTFSVEDDDGGGGTNSRIVATLPASGLYVILANSAFPNQFGGYTLSLNGGGTQCTYTLTPGFAQIPSAGGTFTFDVTTQAGCQWTASALASYIATNSSGTGSGTVTNTVAQNGSGATRNGSIIVGGQFFVITQPSVACTYSLNPSSANVPADASSGSFSVIAPAGCAWSAQSNSGFVSTGSSGSGNGTVNYSVMHNNDAARVATISVSGQTFTINQAGLDCTFSITPNPIAIGRQGGTRTVNLNTQAGCIWSATRNVDWIELASNAGTGAGTISFTVAPQPEAQYRSGAVQIFYGSGSTAVWIDQSRNFSSPIFDFDADGKTDIGIFRPSLGEWWYQKSSNGQSFAAQFGAIGDQIVPADFTGDGKTDVALFRPSTGEWFILRSEDGSFYSFPFGTNGDAPAPADYDGDGKADAAVFRSSTATWFISLSSGGTSIQQFGQPGDVPVVADYDNDGKADIAIYRPSLGQWWINRSRDGLIAFQFGNSTDKPVQGDYTGDGAADVAIFRPSTGEWFVLRSENQSFYSFPFGTNGDIPAPGDFDGDGKFDAAVFRPSNLLWFINRSGSTVLIQAYGETGDRPVPNAFVP